MTFDIEMRFAQQIKTDARITTVRTEARATIQKHHMVVTVSRASLAANVKPVSHPLYNDKHLNC
jgi:hypothetical protein